MTDADLTTPGKELGAADQLRAKLDGKLMEAATADDPTERLTASIAGVSTVIVSELVDINDRLHRIEQCFDEIKTDMHSIKLRLTTIERSVGVARTAATPL